MSRNLDSPTGRTYIGPEEYAYDVKISDSSRRGKAICPDGKVRSVQLGVPDTFFTIPARCKIAGKTVTGFVSVASNHIWVKDDPTTSHEKLIDNPLAGEFEFKPCTYLKNGII